MAAYFASLNPTALWNAAPGGLAQGLIWGIMALGVYLTFRILNFADMTCDGSFALGGSVAVMLLLQGWNPAAVLLISFIAGLAAGLATGILHTVLGIPDILAGILTQISLYSINLNIMGKANQAIPAGGVQVPFTSNIRYLGQTIALTLVVDVVIVGIFYWFLGTELGSAVRATGINANMSRAQGINTNRMKVIAIAIGNALIALSGGILAEYQGFADVKMGQGSIVIGLAAVIIGEVLAEAILGKRLGFVLRLSFVIIGAVVYYFVYVFVLWLKFPADDMKLLTAIVVAIFLAVPYLKGLQNNSFRALVRRNRKMAKAAARESDGGAVETVAENTADGKEKSAAGNADVHGRNPAAENEDHGMADSDGKGAD